MHLIHSTRPKAKKRKDENCIKLPESGRGWPVWNVHRPVWCCYVIPLLEFCTNPRALTKTYRSWKMTDLHSAVSNYFSLSEYFLLRNSRWLEFQIIVFLVPPQHCCTPVLAKRLQFIPTGICTFLQINAIIPFWEGNKKQKHSKTLLKTIRLKYTRKIPRKTVTYILPIICLLFIEILNALVVLCLQYNYKSSWVVPNRIECQIKLQV